MYFVCALPAFCTCDGGCAGSGEGLGAVGANAART